MAEPMEGYTSKLVKRSQITEYPGSYVSLYVAYKISQDAAKNQSTIQVGMYINADITIGKWGDNEKASYVGKTSSRFNGEVPANTKGKYWLTSDSELKTFTVNHNTEGKATATIYWKWGVYSTWGNMLAPSGSFTITLPTIARASTAIAYDCYIGESMTININKAASSFTHTLQYKIAGQSSYTNLVTKTSASSYKFDTSTIAEAAYNLMASDLTYVDCEIRCGTYSGSTLIGITTDNFNLLGTKSKLAPTLNPQIADSDENIRNITKNGIVIVKYYSKPQVFFNVTNKYNASIRSYKVTCGAKSVASDEAVFTSGVESNVFTFTVTDSRGLTTTVTKTLEKDRHWIEAVKPTISLSTTSPELVTADNKTTFKFNATVKGGCYNGLIAPSENKNAATVVTLNYREVGSSTWSNEIVLINTSADASLGINEDGVSYELTKPIEGLDYLKDYEIQANIYSTFENKASGIQTKKATPVFEWSENEFQFNVPVKMPLSSFKSQDGGLKLNNSDIVGANGLYFADTCSSGGEGIYFPNTDSNGLYDRVVAYGGKLYFQPKYGENNTQYKLCITPGDVITLANNTPFFGLLTSARTAVIISIPINKPLVGVSGVTITGSIQMRGSNGYLYNQASNKTEKSTIFSCAEANRTAEGIKVFSTKITGQSVILQVQFNSALTANAAGTTASLNNTPVVLVPDGNLNLTFS